MKKWSERTFNLLTDIIAVIVLLVLLAWGIYWAAQKPVFWLRGIDVDVHGNKEAVTAALLAETLKDKVVGTYFTVDIDKIRDELLSIPWVKTASVFRRWPNKLQFDLTLYQPVAIWGKEEVLSQDGKIFVANQAIAESQGSLPSIDGPKNKSAQIYQKYLDFDKICKEYKYDVVSLTLSDLAGWVLTISKDGQKNIEIVFKSSESMKRMDEKLRNVLTGLPQITQYFGTDPQKLDARYEAGVAVVRPVAEVENEQEGTEIKDGR